MPCDTPPPPSPVEDFNEGNDEEVDESVYEIIDDAEEFEIEDEEDDSTMTFDGHKEAVFCCNFDKAGEYIVTGGQDDTGFVWSVLTKTIKFECTGHTDSVIAAGFSPDSKYVATADMNGLVQLWDMEIGSVIWDIEVNEVLWLEWQKGQNSFFAGCNDGSCWKWKWNVPDMDTDVFPNPNAPCSTGCISYDDEKLVTGYSDGTLKLWNIPNNALLATLSGPSAFKEAVVNITFNADNSLILTGSEDGTAKIIKASDFKVLWTINGCDSSQHEHESVSVEGVGFCHSLPYIAVGTNCGILSFWDLNGKTRRAQTEFNSSVTKIVCDKVAPIIYSSFDNGTLLAHDARTGDIVKIWKGHKASILDLAISSDCRLLVTAADDNTCKIFQRGIF